VIRAQTTTSSNTESLSSNSFIVVPRNLDLHCNPRISKHAGEFLRSKHLRHRLLHATWEFASAHGVSAMTKDYMALYLNILEA